MLLPPLLHWRQQRQFVAPMCSSCDLRHLSQRREVLKLRDLEEFLRIEVVQRIPPPDEGRHTGSPQDAVSHHIAKVKNTLVCAVVSTHALKRRPIECSLLLFLYMS